MKGRPLRAAAQRAKVNKMSNDPYKILGINQGATDDEVKAAYRALAKKYHPDNFKPDDPLAHLAIEKMQQLNEAYDEIMNRRAAGGRSGGSTNYGEIRVKINSGRFSDADAALSAIPELDRNAEWHFLKSVILMRRGYTFDAQRELGIACEMDPNNAEYQRTKEIFNSQTTGYGQGYGAGTARSPYGGASCADLCMGMLCANMLCRCCT